MATVTAMAMAAPASTEYHQHITLEEFTSSPSPLPTILLPRSHALRLLELCELAEMTPTAEFLDFIHGGSPRESSDGGAGGANGARANPHVLVTQMALLLYLGEYVHARHLWRRHRRVPPPTVEGGRGENGKAPNAGDGDSAQLGLLWNAAKYCYLWNTGGINSLGSSCPSSSDGAANNMQVESESEDANHENGDDLPFSTLALRAFQACHSSGTEPLSTYAGELLGVFRARVNRRLHQGFDTLDCDEFRLRMNLEGELWSAFGWKKEGKFLISDEEAEFEEEIEDVMAEFSEKEEDRIEKLTDIVMHLEGKMNA